MPGKPHEREDPSDTHGTRAELLPVILNDGRVLQRQPRLPALGRQFDVDPAHPSAEFPRRCKMPWRGTRCDRSTRISLELVLPSQLQIPLDGQEPARNALGVRQNVPQVLDIGVVEAGQRDRARRPSILLEALDRPRDWAEHAGDVDVHNDLLTFVLMQYKYVLI